MSEITLRSANDGDLEFLYRVLRDALGPYVEQTFGAWDDAEQRELFFDSTNAAAHDIVHVDGTAAGCTCIAVHHDHVQIRRIFLLPEFQNRGVGTRLVEDAMALALHRGVPLRLRVFQVNPAQRLYRRLGFEVTEQTATHLHMEWRAEPRDER